MCFFQALAERRAQMEELNTPEAKAEAKLRLQKKEESDNLVSYIVF